MQKGQTIVQALLDSGNEVKAMSLAYATILGLPICSTDAGAQMINGLTLSTNGIVLANLQMEDKKGGMYFFQETFLVADTK